MALTLSERLVAVRDRIKRGWTPGSLYNKIDYKGKTTPSYCLIGAVADVCDVWENDALQYPAQLSHYVSDDKRNKRRRKINEAIEIERALADALVARDFYGRKKALQSWAQKVNPETDTPETVEVLLYEFNDIHDTPEEIIDLVNTAIRKARRKEKK